MAWTNPGGSSQKRPIHQHHTPSPEELERRVRQKVTEVASVVDSFLGGGDNHAQSEALAMHARYREQGEVAPASSSSSSSSSPSSAAASSSPYSPSSPFSATAHSPPGGGEYGYGAPGAPGSGSGSGSGAGAGAGAGAGGPSYAHTTRPDFHGYIADSYLPAEVQSALSAGAAGAGNRLGLGLGRGGGLGFGLGLGLGSGKDAHGVVEGMGAIGSFFGVNMNMNANFHKTKRRRVSNLDFD